MTNNKRHYYVIFIEIMLDIWSISETVVSVISEADCYCGAFFFSRNLTLETRDCWSRPEKLSNIFQMKNMNELKHFHFSNRRDSKIESHLPRRTL